MGVGQLIRNMSVAVIWLLRADVVTRVMTTPQHGQWLVTGYPLLMSLHPRVAVYPAQACWSAKALPLAHRVTLTATGQFCLALLSVSRGLVPVEEASFAQTLAQPLPRSVTGIPP